MTIPIEFKRDYHYRIKRDAGSLDQRTCEQGSFDEKEERVKVTTTRSHWRERSMDRRHCGEPSFMEDNSSRWSHNPNHSFTEGLRVSVRRIAG
jgi:hypothetical protein